MSRTLLGSLCAVVTLVLAGQPTSVRAQYPSLYLGVDTVLAGPVGASSSLAKPGEELRLGF